MSNSIQPTYTVETDSGLKKNYVAIRKSVLNSTFYWILGVRVCVRLWMSYLGKGEKARLQECILQWHLSDLKYE